MNARSVIRQARFLVPSLAVAAAPLAWGQDAPDPEVTQLTKPTSVIEFGAGAVSGKSFKFGEYNGLQNNGPFFIGNFDVKGGATEGAARWRVTGTNLGLGMRNLSAEGGEQGRFRFSFGYDELLHNISDTYQTPYNGAGSNTLSLPVGWIKPVVPQLTGNSGITGNFRALDPIAGTGPFISLAGVVTNPSAANLNTLAGIRNADDPSFHNFNLSTKRTAYDAGMGVALSDAWDFQASFRHETKEGTKPMGTVSISAVGATTQTASVVIPDLIDQSTDQVNASLNFKNQKSFLQVSYYGSNFVNNVKSMNWQDPFSLAFQKMSSAPNNLINQFGFTGGHNFTPTTRLVLTGSYGRNTQNDGYLLNPTDMPLGVPRSSLNGLVVTESLGAKLTARPSRDWNLSANYKFDERDNRSPVNTYTFYDAGEPKTGASVFNAPLGLAAGTLGSNINIYANRPYSRKTNQLNFDADYALAPGQRFKFGYDWQKIDRWCDSSWIDCADASTTKENTLRAEWRSTVREDLTGRVGYAYSVRRVNYDENAWLSLVPMANVVPNTPGATASVYSTMLANGIGGFGVLAPYAAVVPGNLGIFFPNNSALQQGFYGSRNDIQELYGMRRYYEADRNRDKLRTALNWEPTEKLSLQGLLDFNRDNYPNSVYGLQDSKGWNLTLDGTYRVSESFSWNLYYTSEDQRARSAGDSYSAGALTNAAFQGKAGDTVVSGGCYNTVLNKNLNAKIDPCLNWTTDMKDHVDTFGIGLAHKGLISGKLGLRGDFVYTRARTDVGVNGGTYVNSPFALAGAPVINPAVFFIPATALPTVTTTTIEFRFSADYALDKSSSVRLIYWYQRLRATDYAYDGMQLGTLVSVMPTNQQAPNYTSQVLGASYVYRFR